MKPDSLPSTLRILRRMRRQIEESGTISPAFMLAEIDAAICIEEQAAAARVASIVGLGLQDTAREEGK